MERLMTYLEQTSEGEIIDTAELEELLAECWDEFAGDYGGMQNCSIGQSTLNIKQLQWA